MTAAELIEALRAAQVVPGGGEGVTVSEMAKEAGMHVDAVRELLRPLIADGKVRPSKKRALAMDGAYRMVPSYVLVESRG